MPNEVSITLIVMLMILCVCMFVALLKLQIEYIKLGDKYLDLLRKRNARHTDLPLATLDVMEHNGRHTE